MNLCSNYQRLPEIPPGLPFPKGGELLGVDSIKDPVSPPFDKGGLGGFKQFFLSDTNH
jgi:hypothetical protein